MADHITDVAVSLDEGEEKDLQEQGHTKISVDLNKGAGGKNIFLWFRKDGSSKPITKLQLTYNDDMAKGLINTGYVRIDKDLNAGAGGDYVFLWFFRGSGEFHTPIVDIQVTASSDDDAQYFGNGWQRIGCDLNRKAGGAWVFVWFFTAQQTYICDLIATSSYSSDFNNFKSGYIRVDEDTNRGAGGREIFLWYRQTTDPKRALTDLKVSITEAEHEENQQQGYDCVGQDLNEGTRSDQAVNLWSKRQGINPLRAILLLLQKNAVSAYQSNGVVVIEKNLNAGNKGQNEFICFK